MLHYNPRHVSSINMPIFRRTNCILATSDIVALCKRLHSTPVESRLLSTGVLCRKHTAFEKLFTRVHIYLQVLQKFFYSSIHVILTRPNFD
jgi:hypothetical protein